MVSEQKARATYDNILRMCDDPDVSNVIKFLRAREVVHFQRFGDANHTKLSRFWHEKSTGKPGAFSLSKKSSESWAFFAICGII